MRIDPPNLRAIMRRGVAQKRKHFFLWIAVAH
jgi:hypothetical protein